MNADIPPTHREAILDANALTSRVYDIDGVTDIYPPSAVATQVPQLLSAIVTGQLERINRVEVRTGRDGHLALTARIGTDSHTSAADVARRVADTLLDSIVDLAGASVTVQVARIA